MKIVYNKEDMDSKLNRLFNSLDRFESVSSEDDEGYDLYYYPKGKKSIFSKKILVLSYFSSYYIQSHMNIDVYNRDVFFSTELEDILVKFEKDNKIEIKATVR